MKYRSVFDIIGPVMIGPSSSHTAGANRSGCAARSLLKGEPSWARITLYGSFARTFRGHGTDVAMVGGILGFDASDARLPEALDLARESGIEVSLLPDFGPTDHPNTARIQLGNAEEQFDLLGVSTGGGRIEIAEVNEFPLRFSGDGGLPALLVFHRDRPGAIAEVAKLLAGHGINIAHMEVSREEAGGEALMVLEGDQPVEAELLDAIAAMPFVLKVSRLDCR